MLVKKEIFERFILSCAIVLTSACGSESWNSPYPASDTDNNILYNAFVERPKHLDPAQSYSSNEIQLTAQIYEAPLQYHYLKQPYVLVPLTASRMPVVSYFNKNGYRLSDNARAADIAYSVYEISIKPGILFQPHPAFAVDKRGEYLFHNLSDKEISKVYQLSDFSHMSTRELTASDYVFQIKRLAHPNLHSPIFELMAGYIQGLREFAAILENVVDEKLDDNFYLDLNKFSLKGVQVVDDYTYRVKIKGKYPQFIFWLTMPFFAPIPWEAERFYSQQGLIEKNISLDWFPVGTGAYMLTENNPNQTMVLDKNPNFHGELYPTEGMPGDKENGLLEDAGKSLPFIDKIIYSRERESIPRWNKFLQGYYDASGIGSDSFDQAIQLIGQGEAAVTEAMLTKEIRLEAAIAPSIYYMGFNMLDPVVGGISDQERESARKLRQAISIAVDYEEFISIFANGRGVSAHGPISPGVPGYRAGEAGINPVVYDWIDEQEQRKSIETARALLAEAGYPEGIDRSTGAPLVLYFDVTARGSENKSMLDWMRKQFQKLNIQLVVRSTDYNRFQDKIRKGNAQIFEWGWNADYPDPENFLFLLHGLQRKVENNGENAANYDNEEYNLLFEQMKNMGNGNDRQQIIDQMIDILRHDAPWLWGYHPRIYGLYHSWYKNVKPNRMAQNTIKYHKIDAALRQQKRQEWNKPVLWPLVLMSIVLILGLIPAFLAYRRRERGLGVGFKS